MIAVYVNCATVIVGSLLGLLFAKKLGRAVAEVVPLAAGCVVFVLGVQMAMGTTNVVYLALAVILGGLLGYAITIEDHVENLGAALEKLIPSGRRGSAASGSIESNSSRFAKAFLNASVLFCVGAMSVMGSIKAGLDKDYSIIFTNSVLDGFMAIGFAAAMGIGTAFSALSILVIQGGITLGAGFIARIASDAMLAEVSASGGILVMMIAINLMGFEFKGRSSIKTGNYLPALVLSALFVGLEKFWR
jgi:uncharacterized membrane protein YqgA involved in biofilm formation